MIIMGHYQGRRQGGSWGARDPPFCKPFLTKEPTTDGENAMMISWPLLKSPFFLLSTQCDPTFEKSWLRPWPL